MTQPSRSGEGWHRISILCLTLVTAAPVATANGLIFDATIFNATFTPAALGTDGVGSRTIALSGVGMGTPPRSVLFRHEPANSTNSSVAEAVAPPPLSVPGTSLPNSTINTPFSTILSAQGGVPPYSWALAGGTLPDGLSLRSGGTLAGSPSRTGAFTFSARATDVTGVSAVGTLSVNVVPAPITVITPSPLATGMVGVDYSQQNLTAIGGVPPYTFALSSGSLPAGLVMAPDGTITGTPSLAGVSTFTVVATDSSGAKSTSPAAAAPTGIATLQVQVRTYSLDLVLSAGSLSFSIAAGTVGLPVSQVVEVQSADVTSVLSYHVTLTPPGAPWLAVTPAEGSTPGAFSVSLTSAASSLPVSAAPYTATIAVTCTASSPCGGSTQTVSVSLVVANVPPQLTAINDSLSFTASSVAPQTATQSLLLQNTGGGSVGIGSISCGAAWCTVGAVPGAITAGQTVLLDVSADPGGLSAGYYYTRIAIVSSAGTTVIPVTFLITPYESISLAPSARLIDLQPPAALSGIGSNSFLVSVQGNQPVNWTAALLPGAPWLKLNVTSGVSTQVQPGQVTFTIDPTAAALAVNGYYATIRVSANGVANSPLDFQLVLNVVGAAARPRPLPTPEGLIFVTTVGGAPPPQTVALPTGAAGSLVFQASAATTDGADWLSVSPQTGTLSSTNTPLTTVAVKTAGLSPGVYRGVVAYAYHFFGIRTVNVTLIVQPAATAQSQQPSARELPLPNATAAGCSPTQLVLAQTGLVRNFSSPAAWPTPMSVQLLDDCAQAVANGQVTATFSNGDPPLVFALTDATAAIYAATWTPRRTGPQVTVSARATAPGFAAVATTLQGEVTPNAVPVLNHNATLNVFNPQGGAPVAPGTVAEIFGSNLAAGTTVSSSLPLPNTAQGTSVIIGGLQAPILYVSPGQVNVQVPFELAPGQPYQVVISANGALSAPDSVQLTSVSPGVAEVPGGQLIAQHTDATATLVTDSQPAKPGEFIVLYLVGLGLTDAPVQSGAASPSSPPANALASPSVTLDGEPVNLLFCGLTPDLVGVYQIDLQVPPDAKDGDLTLQISQAGTTANMGILPVHH
jgi:uncharacterized protein (TIGR03437 family)